MVNCWFGAWWFGILGVHPSNNPFHRGIPKQQLTISGRCIDKQKHLPGAFEDLFSVADTCCFLFVSWFIHGWLKTRIAAYLGCGSSKPSTLNLFRP